MSEKNTHGHGLPITHDSSRITVFEGTTMNGGHDLGGMHGFGRINAEPEAAEPVFHADWEKRVFGLTRAIGALGKWNSDMSRHARERQHPADYLRHSYYENWLVGLEKLVLEAGLGKAEELASGR